MLRSTEEIQAELDAVLADDRLGYPVATIDENAPLAMVQLSLECRRDALKWVLAGKE